jgi:hypothetical protein
MNLDTAIAILKARANVNAASIEAFRATCCRVWNDQCSLVDFVELLTNELPGFLHQFPDSYRRGSSFHRVSTAIRDLFKSPEAVAELGGDDAVKSIITTFKKNWPAAVREEVSARNAPLDPGDSTMDDEDEDEESEGESQQEPIETTANAVMPTEDSVDPDGSAGDQHLEFTREEQLEWKLNVVTELFAEYIRAGGDLQKQREVFAKTVLRLTR